MKEPDFAHYLSCFLSVYLPGQAGASRNTILSYRDTFSLFLIFCRDEEHIPPEKITLHKADREMILRFMSWLEEERGCGITTRNQRLAAIHSFFRYLQIELPQHLEHCQRIMEIPHKRGSSDSMNYISLECVRCLLAQPDVSNLSGRRDAVLLSLLYDTGGRVQEIADLKVSDIRLPMPITVKLTGKGNKVRLVPLMEPTGKLVQQYLEDHMLTNPAYGQYPLFSNRSNQKLTRAGIAYILNKYVISAKASGCIGFPNKLSPHCIRHSKAMHLLQSGVNLVYIRDILGHVDIKTTEVYARADEKMKRAALETAYKSPTPEKMPSWKQDHGLLDWLKSLS